MNVSSSRLPSWPEQLNLAEEYWYRLKGTLFYRRVLASMGEGSAIYPPTLIAGSRFIHIGERVTIGKGARLEAVLIDPDNPPEMHIGDDVSIEEGVHIVAMGRVRIHDNVCIAARSSLLCGTHPFFDVRNPMKMGDRLLGAGSFVEIGEGSTLGYASVIQMNVRIGCHVVVGAGSVVKKNIPDYCAVEGNPAAMVLTYDREADRWLPPAGTRQAEANQATVAQALQPLPARPE